MAKAKYKKLADLYTRGVTHVFNGDTVMWIQAMNPFEVDEARKNSQAARIRIVNALKEGDQTELDAVLDEFTSKGQEGVVKEIVEVKWLEYMNDAANSIEVDADWAEKVDLLKRSDVEEIGLPEQEKDYLLQLNGEYLIEVNKRIDEERDRDRARYSSMSETKLLDAYREIYLERRGTQRAMAEYNVNLIFFGSRECDAVPDEEGLFPDKAHEKCDHRVKVFSSLEDVRDLPEELFIEIMNTASGIELTQRDARFSARQGSSSESSPLPSVEEESTPSIQTDPSKTAPGI